MDNKTFLIILKMFKNHTEKSKFINKARPDFHGIIPVDNVCEFINLDKTDKEKIKTFIAMSGFMSSSSVSDILECFENLEESLKVLKMIIDSGIPVANDEISKIFDIFSEEDEYLNNVYDVLYSPNRVIIKDLKVIKLNDVSRDVSNDESDDMDDKPDMKCCVCLDKNKNIIFNDCGHVCVCETCSAKVSKCPICRKVIITKKKAFI